jgi:hypothetical protein
MEKQDQELRAFELGGIFFVPHLLWHGAFFSVPSGGPHHPVVSNDTQRNAEDLFHFIYKTIENPSLCFLAHLS